MGVCLVFFVSAFTSSIHVLILFSLLYRTLIILILWFQFLVIRVYNLYELDKPGFNKHHNRPEISSLFPNQVKIYVGNHNTSQPGLTRWFPRIVRLWSILVAWRSTGVKLRNGLGLTLAAIRIHKDEQPKDGVTQLLSMARINNKTKKYQLFCITVITTIFFEGKGGILLRNGL